MKLRHILKHITIWRIIIVLALAALITRSAIISVRHSNPVGRTRLFLACIGMSSVSYKEVTGHYPRALTVPELLRMLTEPIPNNNSIMLKVDDKYFKQGRDEWGYELLLQKQTNGDCVIISLGRDGVLGGKDDLSVVLWNTKTASSTTI